MEHAKPPLATAEDGMAKRKTESQAPVIACDPKLAAFLGAVRVNEPRDLRRVPGPAMPILARDGSCWLWPVEEGFRAAVARG